MTNKPSAERRARSRWFREPLPFSELASLPRAEQVDELGRRLDEIEKAERAKPNPCSRLLAQAATLRERMKAALPTSDPTPPLPPKRSA
jgi:hypothetical protein